MSDKGNITDDGPLGNPRDFKLDKLWEFSVSPAHIAHIAPSLQPVSRAFTYNVLGVKAQLVFFIFALNFTRDIERHEAIAELELYGKINPDACTGVRSEALMLRIQELYNQANQRIFERDRSMTLEAHNAIRFQMHDMFMRLQLVTRGMPDEVNVGAERYIASMLLGVWTAFETLAGDLWEAALNAHPRILSDLKSGEKTVPINQVQRFGYDLREKMGTILRKKYSFDRLDGIREGFEDAFSVDAEKIRAALSVKALDVLSALRNAIVHKAAIADSEYLSRAKSLPLPQLSVGDKILLDGDLIVPPMKEAIKAGDDLLFAVDEWITQHPS